VRFSFVALLGFSLMAEISGQPLPVILIAGQPFSADEVNLRESYAECLQCRPHENSKKTGNPAPLLICRSTWRLPAGDAADAHDLGAPRSRDFSLTVSASVARAR